ncbi:MAG TPA: hypothetical protein VN324_07950 [Quisquiliibacterium sp.]|nr:hypothetical protein [Quisquiliibacterium sp.]
MSTAREQIMEFMRLRKHATTREISDAVEASQQAVYVQLSNLFAAGELARVAPGVYALPDLDDHAEPEPPQPPQPLMTRHRFTPPPEPGTVAVTIEVPAELARELQGPPAELVQTPAEPAEAEDTTDTPEPLQWALWHDGDLLLRRGETTLVLSLDEATRLASFVLVAAPTVREMQEAA